MVAAMGASSLGCGSGVDVPPVKIADQPGGTIPLHIHLQNESNADPADIDVFVDDTHVIMGQFEADRQVIHVFTVCVRPGPPTMRYSAMGGTITMEVDLQNELGVLGETQLTGEATTGASLDGEDHSDGSDKPTSFWSMGLVWGRTAFSNDYDWTDVTGPVSCNDQSAN